MSNHVPSRRRRVAVLAAGALVAGLAPALMTTAPAAASPGCLVDDNRSLFNPNGCDDDTPPDTRILSAGPALNKADYIRGSSATFTFEAVVSDADQGPWGFMCRLDGTTNGEWKDCSAGVAGTKGTVTYKNLADLKLDGGYDFQVYAVDTTDASVSWTDTTNLLAPKTETAPDNDSASPATRSFKVDTAAPSTFIFNEPYDKLRPEFPMVKSRNIQVRLTSSESKAGEGATYACTLNDVDVPCQEGFTSLQKLTPGNKTFEATATDLAGNTSKRSAKIIFAVPRNLQAPKGSGWRRVREGGYYGADFLEARRVGATIVTKPVQVRELRLIAPAGPNLGSIDLQIGNGQRRTIRLSAATYTRFKVYVIRDEFSPLASGKITIRVKSLGTNKVARIDALLIQPVGGR